MPSWVWNLSRCITDICSIPNRSIFRHIALEWAQKFETSGHSTQQRHLKEWNTATARGSGTTVAGKTATAGRLSVAVTGVLGRLGALLLLRDATGTLLLLLGALLSSPPHSVRVQESSCNQISYSIFKKSSIYIIISYPIQQSLSDFELLPCQ